MRDLLEDALLLVPVALVLFLRLFAGWRKAEKAKAASIRPAAKDAPTKRPAAASSFARLVEKLTGIVPASAGPLEPLHFEEGPAPRGDFKQSRREPAAAEPRPTPLASPAKAPGRPETRTPVTAFAFPAALERLSPLQRAVALSEILGAPRSLQ